MLQQPENERLQRDLDDLAPSRGFELRFPASDSIHHPSDDFGCWPGFAFAGYDSSLPDPGQYRTSSYGVDAV